MAIATANVAINMNNWQFYEWRNADPVSVNGAATVVTELLVENRTSVYTGSGFSLTVDGIATGTLNQIHHYVGATLQYQVTGLNHSASVVSDYLEGDSPAVLSYLFNGSDTLNGSAFADQLNGYAGNDTLNGGLGNDTMKGGAGNDIYVRNATGDLVTELANQGTDTVQSAVAYTLGANLEHLTLTGAGAINGTGNTVGNILTGNAGNNTLDGKGGADTLKGMGGNDTLVWNAADTLFDGGVGTDTLKVLGGNLNLAVIANTKILNVETINLTGGGASILTLNQADVLALSSTTNTLKVLGDGVDSINISGGFVDQGMSGTYHKYTMGAAILLVDADITNVA